MLHEYCTLMKTQGYEAEAAGRNIALWIRYMTYTCMPSVILNFDVLSSWIFTVRLAQWMLDVPLRDQYFLCSSFDNNTPATRIIATFNLTKTH